MAIVAIEANLAIFIICELYWIKIITLNLY
jgi:hypothetical protein